MNNIASQILIANYQQYYGPQLVRATLIYLEQGTLRNYKYYIKQGILPYVNSRITSKYFIDTLFNASGSCLWDTNPC